MLGPIFFLLLFLKFSYGRGFIVRLSFVFKLPLLLPERCAGYGFQTMADLFRAIVYTVSQCRWLCPSSCSLQSTAHIHTLPLFFSIGVITFVLHVYRVRDLQPLNEWHSNGCNIFFCRRHH